MQQKGNQRNKTVICITLFAVIMYFSLSFLLTDRKASQIPVQIKRQLYTTNATRLPIVSTYCTNGAVTITSSDRSTNSNYQSSVSSYMKANATRIVTDLVNQNFDDMWTEIQINGTGTIVFISPFFIGLALLLLFLPFMLCCCVCQDSCPPKCCRGKNPNYSNSELTWPTVFLVLDCILIIGTTVPSMTNSKSFFRDFNCQVSKFLDDFYNGNSTVNQDYFFSGVKEIRTQLTSVLSPKLNNVNTEVSKLTPSVGSTMDTVIADTNAVLSGLKSVPRGADYLQFSQSYNQPLDSSSTSGTFSTVLGLQIGTYGVNSTLLGSLYTDITDNILSNMTTITTAASGVTPHLNAGDMGTQITIADSALAVIQANLDSMNSQFQNFLNLLAKIDSFNNSYSIIFYGIILGMAGLIILAILFMKCFNMIGCRHFIYLVCFVMALFCILLFIYSIVLAIITPTLYYTCQYFQNVFTSPTAFSNMVITLQGNSYANLANQFSQCFGGNNGFMININPTLQGYITQLQNSVFKSKQYDFSSMNSSLSLQLTTMQSAIDNIGTGHLPDFDILTVDGQAQINNFNAIASKSAFSSCSPSSFTIFYQDVWVPGLSATYQSYVSCRDKVGIDNTTCTSGIGSTASCPYSRCIDAFSIISTYYRGGNIGNLVSDADTRYGTCAPFDSFLTNFFNNYVKNVVDNIGNSVDDAANNAKLAGRFVINARTPISNLVNELNGNVKTLFNDVYDSLTITNNLQSIFDPSAGMIAGLDCRLLSQDGVAAKDSLCVTSFNRIYFSLITVSILAFASFLALCCIVCFNVRHYQKSVQKEANFSRIFPVDEISSEIHLK